MLPSKLYSQARRVIDILGTSNKFRRLPLLHPRNNAHEHVIFGCCRCIRGHPRPNLPCAGSARAMPHARDAEEAVEIIHFEGGKAHGLRNVVVVPGGIGGGDQPVLLPVVSKELASFGAKGGKVAGPG